MSLNQSQTEAVRHTTGPMLVLAGPGSGTPPLYLPDSKLHKKLTPDIEVLLQYLVFFCPMRLIEKCLVMFYNDSYTQKITQTHK